MEQIGYQLVDGQGSVVNQWGGTFGQCPASPNPLILPNGDQVCAPSVDFDYGGFQLKAWLAEEPLADAKAKAKIQIGQAAETARGRYITSGSGKAMSYQRVAAEAIRYGATGGAGLYPFLQARVASGRYQDLATAAAAIQQIEAQWAAIGSAIDQAEDAAKLAIDAATTVEQVQAAFEQVQAALQITWP